MAKSIKVLVSCGSGMATSTVVEQAIKEIMKEEGISGTIAKCSTMQLPSMLDGMDVVFLSTRYELPSTVRWMKVFGLISGINEDKERKEIAKLLHEAAEE